MRSCAVCIQLNARNIKRAFTLSAHSFRLTWSYFLQLFYQTRTLCFGRRACHLSAVCQLSVCQTVPTCQIYLKPRCKIVDALMLFATFIRYVVLQSLTGLQSSHAYGSLRWMLSRAAAQFTALKISSCRPMLYVNCTILDNLQRQKKRHSVGMHSY